MNVFDIPSGTWLLQSGSSGDNNGITGRYLHISVAVSPTQTFTFGGLTANGGTVTGFYMDYNFQTTTQQVTTSWSTTAIQTTLQTTSFLTTAIQTTGGGTGIPCNSSSDCSDGNPCTNDYCINNFCSHSNAANGKQKIQQFFVVFMQFKNRYHL